MILPFCGSDPKSSTHPQEYRDCTVRALAHAFDVAYAAAHALLKAGGRKSRRGFHMDNWLRQQVLVRGQRRICGKTVVYKRYPRGTRMTLNQFALAHSKGKYLLLVRGHATTMIDGTIKDSFLPGLRSRVIVSLEVQE